MSNITLQTRLYSNFAIIAVVYLTSALMSWMYGVDITIGNYLWLPMGAKVLAFLLFGIWALPGVLIGSLMSGMFLYDFWSGNTFYGPLGTLVGVFAPLLAIMIMKHFHLSSFFDDAKINFRHVLFLIILSSVINTLVKLFVYIDEVKNIDGKSVDALQFIQTYLPGDILGGIVFVFIVLKILLPVVIKFGLNKAP
jgi:integral membrane sensor domain MASE1